MHHYTFFTLFPDLIEHYINYNAPLTRGIKENIISIHSVNFRDYASDSYKKVDDVPYSGGTGLLLKPDIIIEAVEKNIRPHTKVFLLDPKGEVHHQNKAIQMSKYSDVAFICGRYEGIDTRVSEILQVELISLGNFVLTCGEIAALAILDSVVRLLEGCCHSYESILEESFMQEGLLESDQYTRPYDFRGYKVPDILMSGHHKNISYWKRKNSLLNTIKTRPDVFKVLNLDDIDLTLLRDALKEISYGSEYRKDT